MRHPELQSSLSAVSQCVERITEVFQSGGRLFVAGNGGSAADAQHIAAELVKSFEMKRPLDEAQKSLFRQIQGGTELVLNLENGIPAVALGCNPALTSALCNDFQAPHMEFAQELWVCAEKRDVFLGISTSGKARNVLHAMAVSKAKGMLTCALTGPGPNPMSELADFSITVPGCRTADIQELHRALYHAVCRSFEARLFRT
jgi:D-sedoheptulose 7-phosphate isomerase